MPVHVRQPRIDITPEQSSYTMHPGYTFFINWNDHSDGLAPYTRWVNVSSDESVAVADANGQVTAIAPSSEPVTIRFWHSASDEAGVLMDAYIKEKLQEGPIFGASESMQGFGNLRKAHCMFGWDWGPRLPDAGIWKDIYLLKKDSARLLDIRLDQYHDATRYSLPLL